MHQGRLRLASGFSMNCSYELDSDGGGCLELSSALYNSLGEDEQATLIRADGSEETIRISLAAETGTATFRILGPV